jgi:hypothetical protein
MKKSTSIVRVLTVCGHLSKPEEINYQIDFMTFEKALSKINSGYTFVGEKIELYPYKWYDLRYLYEIPAYWLLLKYYKNSELRYTKKNHQNISFYVLAAEFLALLISILKPLGILTGLLHLF